MNKTLLLFLILFISHPVFAECRDMDAIGAADKEALNLLSGNVFRAGVVLKKHHPSLRKEVASYIQSNDLYYTVFSLVDESCKASVIKRTNGKY